MSEITYKTGWIKDSEGNKFAPITTTDQVITKDGTDLGTELNGLIEANISLVAENTELKNQVAELNSKIFFDGDIKNDNSITINLEFGTRAILYSFGPDAKGNVEYIINSNFSGGIQLTPVLESSSITLSTETGKITIGNSSGYAIYVGAIVFYGAITV